MNQFDPNRKAHPGIGMIAAHGYGGEIDDNREIALRNFFLVQQKEDVLANDGHHSLSHLRIVNPFKEVFVFGF